MSEEKDDKDRILRSTEKNEEKPNVSDHFGSQATRNSEEKHGLSSGVIEKISSESFLFFELPMIFWVLVILVSLLLFGTGRSFRLSCSLVWCFFALASSLCIFFNWVVLSIVEHLLGYEVSMKNKFSYFYQLAKSVDKKVRWMVCVLGFGKVVLFAFSSSALWGGLFVVVLWLTSGQIR